MHFGKDGTRWKLNGIFGGGVLGVFVMWLLRRRWRSFPTIAVIMGAMICSLTIPSVASAAERKHGDPNYTLPAGEEVKTDRIVFADHTQINGDIDGDLIALTRNVTVNGHVKGDVIAFAQELRVNGAVDGNVRAFVQTLQLNSTVERNVMAWVGDVNLDEKARVNGTMTLGAGQVQLDGQVVGDLPYSGDANVNGLLGHNAMIHAGHVTIGPRADIKGQTKVEARRAAGSFAERETRKSLRVHAREARIRKELFVREVLLAPSTAVGSKLRLWTCGPLARAWIFLRYRACLQKNGPIHWLRLAVPVCHPDRRNYCLHHDCGPGCWNFDLNALGYGHLFRAGLCGSVVRGKNSG